MDVEKDVVIKLVNYYKGTLSVTWLYNYFGVAIGTYYRWSKKVDVEDIQIKMIQQL